MGRHAQGEPIPLAPGQPPYGAEGPPARLRAGYLRRNDPTRDPEDLGPRIRSAWELSGWEQAVLAPPWFAICLVLVVWGPDHGLLERVLPFALWAVAHGPLYWAVDRYAMTHEPWRGPTWARRWV
jgi:hypothetical protein